MSKFEVNIDNYTDEQKAQLGELIKIGQEPQRSIFDPKVGDVCYYIGGGGTVFAQTEKPSDLKSKFGNACTDEVVMETKAKDMKIWSLLWNFAYENNEWSKGECEKSQVEYYISYDFNTDKWVPMTKPIDEYGDISSVYFSSYDVAQSAIKNVIIPWEKGQL